MAVFIEKTLEGLKELLDERGQMKILGKEGTLNEVECQFFTRATDQEITEFEKKLNVTLPEDYRVFLKTHNGARIYDVMIYGSNVGGGLHILSLKEIYESMQTIALLKPTFIPVAHLLDGCYLLIDKTKASTDPNYLWLLNQTEYEFLNLNFELFVDRYIVSQGANFWKWNLYSAENYYRTN
ncbi:SMI1/KNR4 family protein [Bacillus rugosus]|uniref:SMI1/KNR4 family protein n=1 Tax=Bacillus rugosus TaxID=2715209 RepID=UPI002DB76AD7|nr:SMI1/KNR4 family protein [Bacillus rugosus]MEC1548275.1 SMI1/KNR4 family protein [Bacillus rugosus]